MANAKLNGKHNSISELIKKTLISLAVFFVRGSGQVGLKVTVMAFRIL